MCNMILLFLYSEWSPNLIFMLLWRPQSWQLWRLFRVTEVSSSRCPLLLSIIHRPFPPFWLHQLRHLPLSPLPFFQPCRLPWLSLPLCLPPWPIQWLLPLSQRPPALLPWAPPFQRLKWNRKLSQWILHKQVGVLVKTGVHILLYSHNSYKNLTLWYWLFNHAHCFSWVGTLFTVCPSNKMTYRVILE